MTQETDSTLDLAPRGTSFRGLTRLTLRIAITAAVVIGIGQSIRLAWADLHSTHAKIDAKLQEIDLQLATTQSEPERLRLESERSSVANSRLDWNRITWSWIPVSILAGLVAIALTGVFWWLVFRSFGKSPPFMTTQAAYAVGTLGKYVPGKAMVLILRSGPMRRCSIPIPMSVTAIIVEILVSLSTAGTLGALTLTLANPPGWILQALIGAAILSLVPIAPPIFKIVIRWVARQKRTQLNTEEIEFGWTSMIGGWLLVALGWLWMGTSLWGAAMAVSSVSEPSLWIHCVGASTIGFVIGFLSMLPGGAGVRELIVTMLLAPSIGYAPALAASILYRLSNLAAELLMAGLTSIAARWMDAKMLSSVP